MINTPTKERIFCISRNVVCFLTCVIIAGICNCVVASELKVHAPYLSAMICPLSTIELINYVKELFSFGNSLFFCVIVLFCLIEYIRNSLSTKVINKNVNKKMRKKFEMY